MYIRAPHVAAIRRVGGSPGWPSRAAGKAHLSTRLMEGGRDGRGEAVTRRADMQQQQHSAAQDKHRPPRRHGKMSGRHAGVVAKSSTAVA